jgi:nitrogen regulatory protein PII-like uncharacterized protein
MKLIFLDIDGVLVTPTSHTNFLEYKEMADVMGVLPNEDAIFERDAIRNLRELVSRTGAKVVVISQWRKTISIGKIIKMLNDAGFLFWYKILNTDDWFCSDAKRSREIKDFLRAVVEVNRYHEEYVIIDDSKDYEDYQLKHLVSPDPEKGFTREDMEKAIKILEGAK